MRGVISDYVSPQHISRHMSKVELKDVLLQVPPRLGEGDSRRAGFTARVGLALDLERICSSQLVPCHQVSLLHPSHCQIIFPKKKRKKENTFCNTLVSYKTKL